jgi:hypothetical protein
VKSYFLNILVGLDQFLGTLAGIPADITISGWVGHQYPGSLYEKLLDKVFGAGHCKESIEWDVIARLKEQGVIK